MILLHPVLLQLRGPSGPQYPPDLIAGRLQRVHILQVPTRHEVPQIWACVHTVVQRLVKCTSWSAAAEVLHAAAWPTGFTTSRRLTRTGQPASPERSYHLVPSFFSKRPAHPARFPAEVGETLLLLSELLPELLCAAHIAQQQ